MITVACEKCGSQYQLDEKRIPVSGIVMKCPACAQSTTVFPPDSGDEALSLGALFQDMEQEASPGAAQFGEIVDLPSPKRLGESAGLADLPAPKFQAGRGGPVLDLPELDGFGSESGPDLLAPVGPMSSREVPDLLAPAGPASQRNAGQGRGASPEVVPDLLSPVGPSPTRGTDLPTPVGPTPTKGVDLLSPVGPSPRTGGFFDDTPRPASPTPRPGMGAMPATPRSAPGAAPTAPPVPALDLDDLELVPAGAPGEAESLDLGFGESVPDPEPSAPPRSQGLTPAPFIPPPSIPSFSPAAPPSIPPFPGPSFSAAPVPDPSIPPPSSDGGGFSLDNLDLMPSEPSPEGSALTGSSPEADASGPAGGGIGMSFGEVDLGQDTQLEAIEGVVSFSSGPSARSEQEGEAPPPPARPRVARVKEDLDIAALPTPTAKPKGTLAGDDHHSAQTKGKRTRTAAELKKLKIGAAVAAGVVLLLGGGIYGYVRMQAAKERETTIKNSLAETRKLLSSDEAGHWDRAVAATQKALKIDPKNAEALGFKAQALMAATLDEGTGEKARIDRADEVMNEIGRLGAHGPEIEKAQAVRMILDGKGEEAAKALAGLGQVHRDDLNLPLYQGWAELDAGRAEKAKNAFERAAQMSPGRLPALYGSARALLAMGQSEWPNAKAAFDKVLAKRSGHVGARIGLAEMVPRDRLGTREKRLAEIVLSKEAETAHRKDLSRAWSLYGDEALIGGRVDDAATRYNEAQKDDPRNLDASVGIAITSMEQGKLPEARSRLDTILALAPSNIHALLGATRLSLLEGKVADAHNYIDRAVAVDSASSEVQLWLGHVLEKDSVGPGILGAQEAYQKSIELDKERYEAYIALSRLLLSQGKAEEGLQVLSPVEKAAGDDTVLANTLGAAYLGANDPTKAESWFRQALLIDGKNIEARSNLGAALEAQGKTDEAIQEYENANERAGGSREDIALKLAMAYEKSKRVGDAEKLFDRLLTPKDGKSVSISARAAAGRFFARRNDGTRSLSVGDSILAEDPRHPAGMFLRGFGLLADEKLLDARKAMTEAVSIDPQAQYYDGLGRVYERQMSLDDALGAYDNAIKRDPNYVAPRLGRARIYMLRREWSLALPEFQTAIKIEPELAEGHLGVGECLVQLGASSKERGKAIPFLVKATELNPKLPAAYFLLGQVYYDDDKRSHTIESLKRFVEVAGEKDENLPNAYRMLGYTYKANGKKGEACDVFKKYMEVAPPSAARADVEKLLYSCN
ncbi:MAG: zinc-ribbon domain-containing protein [Deltaproteobacteria bacterium]|nr:zinc-ribbon domain-containing protein [Deltaproteobacteria bacterium]